MISNYKIILIGGSAGSLSVVIEILHGLPAQFPVPIVIVLHRQKNVLSEMRKILSLHANGNMLIEPEDKMAVQPSHIYLAPQNYHLLIEGDQSFSLDYSEPVQYSRPSIDVTFESAARVYKQYTLGILLSGANSDGTAGLNAISAFGGMGIVQSPQTAEYPVMPQSALNSNSLFQNFTQKKIVTFIQSIEG